VQIGNIGINLGPPCINISPFALDFGFGGGLGGSSSTGRQGGSNSNGIDGNVGSNSESVNREEPNSNISGHSSTATTDTILPHVGSGGMMAHTNNYHFTVGDGTHDIAWTSENNGGSNPSADALHGSLNISNTANGLNNVYTEELISDGGCFICLILIQNTALTMMGQNFMNCVASKKTTVLLMQEIIVLKQPLVMKLVV